jgi:hypothetical protein
MTKVRREAKVRRDDAAAESGAMTPPKKAVSLTRTNGRARSERPARRRHDRASFLLPWPFGPLRAASAQRQALWGSEGGEAEHRCLRENSREARRPRNPQRGHAFCTATVFGPAGSRTIGVVTVRSSPPSLNRAETRCEHLAGRRAFPRVQASWVHVNGLAGRHPLFLLDADPRTANKPDAAAALVRLRPSTHR